MKLINIKNTLIKLGENKTTIDVSNGKISTKGDIEINNDLINISENNSGIALGKTVSKNNTLECDIPTEFSNTVEFDNAAEFNNDVTMNDDNNTFKCNIPAEFNNDVTMNDDNNTFKCNIPAQFNNTVVMNARSYQYAPEDKAYTAKDSTSGGYTKFMRITLSGSYNYEIIRFSIASYATHVPVSDVDVICAGASTIASSPIKIYCSNCTTYGKVYGYKVSDGVWDLYMAKTGSACPLVFNIQKTGLYDSSKSSYTLCAEHASSLPSGYISPIYKYLDTEYPVGSIFQSTSSTNPGTYLGGTWVSIPGRVLIGAGTLSDGTTSMTFNAAGTGGEYYHTLSVSELPSHNHYLVTNGKGTAALSASNYLGLYAVSPNTDLPYSLRAHTSAPTLGKSSSTGSGTKHNNLPPYYSVYIWRRTA